MVTCQALGSKCMESDWLLGSPKAEINTSCVDDYESVICPGVQTDQLSAQNSLAVVETIIELDSYADTCVVGDQCLVAHDHNRPVNVFGYNSTVRSKHSCIVDATIVYTEHETGQYRQLRWRSLVMTFSAWCKFAWMVSRSMKSPSFGHLYPVRLCMLYS